MKRYALNISVLALVASFCLFAVTSTSAGHRAQKGALTTVRVGYAPFYDYQFFKVADKLGIDKEFGLDIKGVDIPGSAPYKQLRRGDIDIAASCQSCAVPVYPNFPNLRHFMITQQFKGFVVIGRKGAPRRTYAQVLKDVGGNKRRAEQVFVRSLRGTTWPLSIENDLPLLAALLAKGGLKTKDVEIIGFPDESKAALAFIRGEGDYYFGSLPQEIRMTTSPDLKDQFVVAGPASLFPLNYANWAATQEWLEKNEETALRLIAIWFRTTRYLYEKPEAMLRTIAESLQTQTGGLLSNEATKAALLNFNYFPRFEKAEKHYYDPNGDTWEGRALQSLFSHAKEEGRIPKNLKWQTYEVGSVWFKKLKQRKDLIKLINAPLK